MKNLKIVEVLSEEQMDGLHHSYFNAAWDFEYPFTVSIKHLADVTNNFIKSFEWLGVSQISMALPEISGLVNPWEVNCGLTIGEWFTQFNSHISEIQQEALSIEFFAKVDYNNNLIKVDSFGSLWISSDQDGKSLFSLFTIDRNLFTDEVFYTKNSYPQQPLPINIGQHAKEYNKNCLTQSLRDFEKNGHGKIMEWKSRNALELHKYGFGKEIGS